MTDLVDEVKASFEKCRDDHSGGRPTIIIDPSDEELCPGFHAMRGYYENRILVMLRRGYRHFAGSTMPTDADELGRITAQTMTPMIVAITMLAFADGVLIGHRNESAIKIAVHFGMVETLFQDRTFQEKATAMASGFADDQAVREFFKGFIEESVGHMAHATGFAHSEVKPDKIWDIWALSSTGCIASGYMAGYQLGTTWRERDVLDGIVIATEGEHGSE